MEKNKNQNKTKQNWNWNCMAVSQYDESDVGCLWLLPTVSKASTHVIRIWIHAAGIIEHPI